MRHRILRYDPDAEYCEDCGVRLGLPDKENTLTIQIVPFGKRVVLHLSALGTPFEFTPKEARMVAGELLRVAKVIDGGKTRRGKKKR